MAGSNKVSLIFGGDATQLDRTYKQVQQGGEKTSVSLKHVERGTRDLAEGLDQVTRHSRASADAIDGLTSVMGTNASQALILTRGFADLSDGAAVLAPKAKDVLAQMKAMGPAALAGRVGIVALGTAATVAAFKLGEELGKSIFNVQSYANQLDLSPISNQLYGMSVQARQARTALDALGKVTVTSGLDPLNTGTSQAIGVDQIGDLLKGTVGMNGNVATSYDKLIPVIEKNTAKISKAAGSSASKAIEAAAQAAKAKLSKFQQIADQFSDVAKQIAGSFGPNLEAGDQQNVVAGTGSGMSLLQKLKKQADDTIRLNKDLAKLARGGLDPGLLTNLVNGGLASLPAVEELLAGGAGELSQANKYASQINAAGGSIAGAEAAREIKNQDKPIKLEVDLSKASQGDFEKFFAKMIQTKGAKSFGLRAA